MRIVSRRTVCIAALVLGVAFLHREVLFAGQVYHQEDAADGYYPSHVAILRALSDGELPTWEPGSWCGWPLNVDPYYGLFYPPSLLYAVVGAVRGTGITIALHALAAGLAMLWLLRRRKLDWGPALLGAVSLAFGSFMVERIRHIIFAQLMAWLPLILVGVEGYLQSRRARELILAAIATGMALICGALPLAPFVMLIVAAYVLPRIFSRAHPQAEMRVEEPRKRAAWLMLAALLGGAIAAAQIVPTVMHLPYSPRSLGVDYTFASTYAWPDWRYLAVLVAPDSFGTAERGHWFGAFNHWEMAGWYAGAITVALAPLALFRRRGELYALFAVTLMAILLALGDHGPLHRFFFHHVPLYGALRCPTRALVMALVALPILAAEGLAWTAQKALKQPIGIVLALALLIAGIAIAVTLHHYRGPEPIRVARDSFAHMTLVLTIGGAILLLGLARVLPVSLATVFVALVSLVDLVSISRGYVQPKPADWAPGTERFAAVDWLLEQHPRDRFVPDWRGPFRLHNLGMTYAIEGASGYESFTVWRYVNLLYTINNGAPYPYAKLRQDLAAGDIRRFDTPLVDLLNVRWFIGMQPPTPVWIERFRPTPGAPPHAVHEPGWDPQLNVYENPRVLPRAFVVHHATVIADDKAEARALTTLDPRHDVILDAAPAIAPEAAADPSPAKIVAHERKRVVLESDAQQAGILILSDTWYPGWRAFLDGKPVPLLRADYAFRGVAVPSGHHTITMTFSSTPTRIGLLLSLLGLLGVVAVGFVGRRRPSVL